VITRNLQIAIVVLLAGLGTGYIASRVAAKFHERVVSELLSSTAGDLANASLAHLSMRYDQSKDRFREVVKGSDAVREAALREVALTGRELDLFSLENYYRQFYMHYYRWLDTGNAQSAVQYQLSMGQFEATLNYLEEKQGREPYFSQQELVALRTVVRMAAQSDRTMRWARVVVMVLLFLLVLGIPRFIRKQGHKKFAGSLYFDSLFRPHLVSDLNRWHSIRRMAAALVVLCLFSLVIFTFFISWRLPLLFGVLGLIRLLTFTGMSGNPKKLPEMVVSFMAPLMPVVIMVLGIVAVRGPHFFWYRFWGTELFRIILLSLLFMFVFRKVHLEIILARKWSHRNRTASAALVGIALGFQLLVAGAWLEGFGSKASLELLNKELLLLPPDFFGPARHQLPSLLLLGGVLTAASLILFRSNRKKLSEIARST
jgi:hypothetical protein